MKSRPFFPPIVEMEAEKRLNTASAKQGDHQSGMEREISRGGRGGISHL